MLCKLGPWITVENTFPGGILEADVAGTAIRRISRPAGAHPDNTTAVMALCHNGAQDQ